MAPLRLMTWNLRRDVPADGALRWQARRFGVAAMVRDAAPHALATQEGLPAMLTDLDADVPHLRRVGGCRRGDGTDEHNALYYDPSRLLLVAHGDVWLSDAPHEPGSATWGNRLPRLATWGRFTDQDTGASWTLVSTHFDHESAHARSRSADLLAARFPGAVLMGDFNEEPGGAVHRTLARAGWRDAGASHPGGTFHGYGAVEGARIDWILLPTLARGLTHRVLLAEGGTPASDHHAVLVEAVAPVEPRTVSRESL